MLDVFWPAMRPPAARSWLPKPPLPPRTRALSVGSSVARCGALLAHIRRPKTAPAHADEKALLRERGDGEPAARESEESDAMDTVMREMYGTTAWNADADIGGGGGGGSGGQAASSRRHAGKVYTVNGGVDEMGSTLRLVQTPSTAVQSPF